jgi:hypothetical protein
MGIFNEPMTERSSMARIATTHELVDILFQQNPLKQEPPIYARGPNRIDYALISADLVDAVKYCGYKPFQQRIKSDHRGLFLDFNTSILFGNATAPLGPMSQRDFTAKCPTNNSKYITAKHAHLVEQDFFKHLAHLQSLPEGDHQLAERLDTNLREASKAASNKVKRFYKSWWSLAITKARATVDILRRQLSGFKTNIDVRKVLLELIKELSLDLTLPHTQNECNEALKTSIATLKDMEKNSLALRHDKLEAKATIATDSGNKDKQQPPSTSQRHGLLPSQTRQCCIHYQTQRKLLSGARWIYLMK